MKQELQNIKVNLKMAASLPFLKFYCSNRGSISLPDIQHPYLYLILDGKMQLPDMQELKAGEYFISAID